MNFTHPKIKQHFVMKNYLKRWMKGTVANSKRNGFWAYSKERKNMNFVTDLNSRAQERFFYELHIDSDVFALLKADYERHPECKPTLDWLEVLNQVHSYKEEKELHYEKLNFVNTNILEEIYSDIENNVSKILSYIDNDLDGYIENAKCKEQSLDFFAFLFYLQFFRTKSYRKNIGDLIHTIYINWSDGQKQELSKEQKENYLIARSYLESIVHTSKIIKNGFTIELLENKNPKSFITSDAPAIPISGSSHHIETFVGYMPLTPNLAMIINGNSLHKTMLFKTSIRQEQVIQFNKIVKKSDCQDLYSVSQHI